MQPETIAGHTPAELAENLLHSELGNQGKDDHDCVMRILNCTNEYVAELAELERPGNLRMEAKWQPCRNGLWNGQN